MANIQKVSDVGKKFYKKSFINTTKIQFGEQVDKSTGEITYKNFQACIYLPDGEVTPYKPKVCLNLKLGNDSITFIDDSIDGLYMAVENLYKWMFKMQEQTNIKDLTIKSVGRFYQRLKEQAEEGNKKDNSVK